MSLLSADEHIQVASPAGVWARSAESHDFEAFWRSLRGKDLLPTRSTFNPSKAARFLRDIVMTEAPRPDGTGMRIRVCGERTQELAGRNLAGEDYLDLLPQQYHAGVIAAAQLMLEKPCGLWQITPVHLSRGYAQRLECTVFPLGPGNGVGSSFLTFLRPVAGLLLQSLPVTKGLAVDTADDFHFIDIGAGTPVWRAAT